MASKLSVAGFIVLIITLIVGIYFITNIPLEALSKKSPVSIKISYENSSLYESIYLWRERLYDTIFQSLVLVAALAGVLIFVVEVRLR